MNNNETNYEFVDRDYDSVVNGNEKKIQFYSRTYDAICNKYKQWRQNKIKKSIVNVENQIYSNTNILNNVNLSEHSQDKINRKLANLQDKVEYLNLALDDEKYLNTNVRLLKVAERAKNSIGRWWKDFIKNVPVVGKIHQKSVVVKDDASKINVDDIISPQTVEEMINAQFDENNKVEQTVNSEQNKPSHDTPNFNQGDTIYRFGPVELANMPGKRDIIDPTYNDAEMESSKIDDNDDKVENKVETGMIPVDVNTSLIVPGEYEKNFRSDIDGVNGNSNIENVSESYIDDIISGSANIIDDKDTIESLEQYRAILKKQAEKKKQMNLQRKEAMKEYERAQEKNNEVRDQNSYLKNVISSRLNMMEMKLNEESQKTQEELDLMRDKTDKLNSNTSQLDQSNESLKVMCNELNIDVQTNINDSVKGKSR